ncbi:NAD(P)-dependent dehydrogenase, short-chain alcohol dehydrogenase family [Parafrankia irregularis]|uniref:NAD(P)-dependent dehydrogenase, short-chain alcohol dehydrogenase family n=1 Tax=Parafrankia irregularis TaxID=795642 RepID=A0A0S4QR27_9ACTN|nr:MULTISPECIES: SDR family oxidoreductase [Parafrankia]MBE3201740.1 SDR family oxidoreductase [Parafrankia sp. CH37]CUU57490.1 NAD(P)-dependent dehydrogenase, short-chain alcohol dehydrogenase family [Parafrankia irregularis]
MFGDKKVAIITGVGPGMGRSIALGLARYDVDVVLAARQPARLGAVAEEVRRAGRDPLVVPTDITDPASCQALVDAAVERFGGVDVLVQNAHHEGDWAPVADADTERWRAVFDVNLYGTLHLVQSAVPAIRARGGGAVVLVNSGAVLSNPPNLGAYTASKAALAAVARTLAVEVGQWGIRVNGVFLGGVLGDNIRHAAEHQSAAEGITPEEWFARRNATLPLRHMPTPDECAGAVLFLCSDLAAAVTGQHLSVNGGQWTT